MKKIVGLLCISLSLFACKNDKKTETEQANSATTEKIVSLNGAITEVLVQLGEEKNIVGVDVTSNYPASLATSTQNLGHIRSVNAESVLKLQPTVVFATKEGLNPDLEAKLKASGVKFQVIDQKFSVEGTSELIKEVATTMKKDNYQPMIDAIQNKLKEVKPLANKPKVLFIYARGAATLMVGGKETPFDAILQLAGAENAAKEVFGFKPLTPESLVQTNPDVILMFDSGLQSLGGVDGLMKIEGVSATNAGKNKKVITMEGQLLSGFGPRLGEATVELNRLLQ